MGKTAVLVIDVVKDFTDPAGKVPHPQAADIVPRIDAFVQAARARGAVIIWVIDSHRPGKPDWELENVRAHCEAARRASSWPHRWCRCPRIT